MRGFFAGLLTRVFITCAWWLIAGRAVDKRRLQQAYVQRDLTPQQALRDTKARTVVLTWRRSSWPYPRMPETEEEKR